MTKNYFELISHIADAIAADDCNQSERLADLYLSSDAPGKDLLDQAFICLCGWKLDSLMAKAVGTDSVGS